MNALVTGGGGLLAQGLLRVLERAGIRARVFTRTDLDVTDGPRVREVLRRERPDVVFHLAAYTAVVSFVILKGLEATVGLRVDANDEEQGLDLALHDESGYRF